MATDVEIFEAERPALVAHAYRMLGEMGRVEELVQEAWLRWEKRPQVVDSPEAWLLKTVTNLCLNELDSARARREESRASLPEPVDLSVGPLGKLEAADQISMAFLVMLQRLTAAERAVLLLHEVFDFDHAEIAEMLGKTEAGSRQLLRRARENVGAERRALVSSREEHERLLRAFAAAAASGDLAALKSVLADDAVLRADGGPAGVQYGAIRNLPGPVEGAERVAAFVAATAPEGTKDLEVRPIELNGSPSLLFLRGGQPYAAMLISAEGGRIRRVFVQADPAKLARLGGGE
jgi:RNA polymerase sigma-70 factor (ECF subfamily)